MIKLNAREAKQLILTTKIKAVMTESEFEYGSSVFVSIHSSI
jgi:hypothetical protein